MFWRARKKSILLDKKYIKRTLNITTIIFLKGFERAFKIYQKKLKEFEINKNKDGTFGLIWKS